MPTILGHNVGSIGYGLQWHTLGHKIPSQEQAFEAMRVAADMGCLVWDGGEFYGKPDYNSLVLLNRFFTQYPHYAGKIVLNIKGASQPNFMPNGSPEFVRSSVSNCLAQLEGKAKIAMFECARRDMEIPLETTLNTLKSLVDEGQIGSVALSEVNANTIREAAKIVKISAVEIELSIWCTDPLSNGITSTCAELGIPVLAYCPLGRGMLTGDIQSVNDMAETDLRRIFPRFHQENFESNLKLVNEIQALASKKGCTTAQMALGWLLTISKREDMPVIIPIPGATSVDHVRENAQVVELTEDEMDAVESIIVRYPVAGERYHPMGMKLTNM